MLSFLDQYSNLLIALTSICAVVISVVSVVFTVRFSSLQIKHNQNSVRPISAIKVSDYENSIAVKIGNHGTGPLIIKKLYFTDEREDRQGIKYDTIIELMPSIDQSWNTFTECVNGWSIPVNGNIIPIALKPISKPMSDLTKRKVRGALSTITVHLEYKDIYDNEFTDERKLDFFGRHFRNPV